MDETDRKKKLQAGKEKLAAFQKKKAKRKKRPKTVGLSNAEQEELSGASDVQSVCSYEDSDQLSLASGDDLSATEEDDFSYTVAHNDLRSAVDRIAELEESLLGKQTALDAIMQENDNLRQTRSENAENEIPSSRLSNGKLPKLITTEEHSIKIQHFHAAIAKRDEVISQLTASVRATADKDRIQRDYSTEVQQLSSQLQLLQSQLQQAGSSLQSQMTKHHICARALTDSKNEILSLQKIILNKDEMLCHVNEQLSHKSKELINMTDNYENSKQRENELIESSRRLANDLEDTLKAKVSEEMKSQQIASEMEEIYSEQIVDLENEILELKESELLLTGEVQEANDRCKALLDQEEDLCRENECYQAQNDELKNKINSHHDQLASLISKLEDASEESDALQLHVSGLSEEVMQKDNDLTFVREESETKTKQIFTLECNCVQLNSDLLDTKHIIEKHDEDAGSFKDQISHLENQLSSMVSENSKLQKEQAILEKSIHVQSDLDTERLVNESKNEKQSLLSEIESLKLELENVQTDTKAYVDKESNLLVKIENLESEVSHLTSSNEALSMKMSDLEIAYSIISPLQSDFDKLKTFISNASDVDSLFLPEAKCNSIDDVIGVISNLTTELSNVRAQAVSKSVETENLQFSVEMENQVTPVSIVPLRSEAELFTSPLDTSMTESLPEDDSVNHSQTEYLHPSPSGMADSALRHDLDEAKMYLRDMTEKVYESQSEVQRLQDESDRMRDEHFEVLTENQRLLEEGAKQLTTQLTKMEDRDSEIKILNERCVTLSNEVSCNKDNFDTFATELQELFLNKEPSLTSESDNVHNLVDGSETSSWLTNLELIKKAFRSKNTENEDLKNKCDTLEKDLLSRMDANQEHINKEISRLQTRVETYEKEEELLQIRITEYKEKEELLQDVMEKKLEEVSHCKEQIDCLQSEKDRNIKEQAMQKETLDNEIKQMENEICDVKCQLETVLQCAEEKVNQELSEKHNELCLKINQLHQDKGDLEERCTLHRQRADEMEGKIQVLSDEVLNLKSELETNLNEQNLLNEQVIVLTNDNQSLTDERDIALSKTKSTTDETIKLKEELQSNSDQVQKFAADLRTSGNEMEELLASICECRSENKLLLDQNADLQQQVDIVQDEVKLKEEIIDKMEVELLDKDAIMNKIRDDREREINRKISENQQLSSNFELSKEEKQNLLAEKLKLELEISGFMAALEEKDDHISKLTQECDNLQCKKEKSDNSLSEVLEKFEHEISEKAKLLDETERLIRRVRLSNEERQALVEENERLSNETMEKLHDLMEEKDQAFVDLERTCAENEILEKKYDELLKDLECCQKDHVTEKGQLIQDMKLLKDEVNQMIQQKQSLQERNQNLEETLARKNTVMLENLEEAQALQSEMKALAAEMVSKSDEVNNLVSEKNKLEGIKKNLEGELNDARFAVSVEKENASTGLNEMKCQLKDKVESHEQSVAMFQSQKDNLTSQIQGLEQQLLQECQEKESCLVTKEERAREIQNLTDNVEKYRQEACAYKDEMQRVQEEMDRLLDDQHKLEYVTKQATSDATRLASEKKSCKKTISHYEEQISELEIMISSCQEQVGEKQQLDMEINRLRTECEKYTDSNSLIIAECDTLRNTNDKLKEMKTKEGKEKQLFIHDMELLRLEYNEALDENSAHLSEIQDLKKSLNKTNHEKEQLNDMCRSHDYELDDIRSRYKAEREVLERQLEPLQVEEYVKDKDLEEMQQEKANLSTDLENLQLVLASMQAEMHQSKIDLEESHQMFLDQSDKYSESKAKNQLLQSDYQKQMKDFMKEKAVYERHIETLQEQLEVVISSDVPVPASTTSVCEGVPIEDSCVVGSSGVVNSAPVIQEELIMGNIVSDQPTDDDVILNQNLEIAELKENIASISEQMKSGISKEEFDEKVKNLEEHHKRELDLKADTYEERMERELRKLQLELSFNFDLDKKQLEKDTELRYIQKVERVNREKEKAFVDALRKVRKDLEQKHKQDLVKIDQRKQQSDAPGEKTDVHRLEQDNEELAQARDALLQQIEMSNQNQDRLRDELQQYVITGEDEPDMEQECSDSGPTNLLFNKDAPLDWEISPQTSFDTGKTLSDGGLFENIATGCGRKECQILRKRYEFVLRQMANRGNGETFWEESFAMDSYIEHIDDTNDHFISEDPDDEDESDEDAMDTPQGSPGYDTRTTASWKGFLQQKPSVIIHRTASEPPLEGHFEAVTPEATVMDDGHFEAAYAQRSTLIPDEAGDGHFESLHSLDTDDAFSESDLKQQLMKLEELNMSLQKKLHEQMETFSEERNEMHEKLQNMATQLENMSLAHTGVQKDNHKDASADDEASNELGDVKFLQSALAKAVSKVSQMESKVSQQRIQPTYGQISNQQSLIEMGNSKLRDVCLQTDVLDDDAFTEPTLHNNDRVPVIEPVVENIGSHFIPESSETPSDATTVVESSEQESGMATDKQASMFVPADALTSRFIPDSSFQRPSNSGREQLNRSKEGMQHGDTTEAFQSIVICEHVESQVVPLIYQQSNMSRDPQGMHLSDGSTLPEPNLLQPAPTSNVPDERRDSASTTGSVPISSDSFDDSLEEDLKLKNKRKISQNMSHEDNQKTISDKGMGSSSVQSLPEHVSEDSNVHAETDGHSAYSVKHFELIQELTQLRRSCKETKDIYIHDTALLRETLDRERLMVSNLKQTLESQGLIVPEFNFPSDVIDLRQKISILRESNRVVQEENNRFMQRLRDQEILVTQLRNSIDVEPTSRDHEDAFNMQVRLLQKQRDDLLQKLSEKQAGENELSTVLGENAVLEENLRREKQLLSEKMFEKSMMEIEVNEQRLALEKQIAEQRRLEELLLHKDKAEQQIMRQKRLLEEELYEIEHKLQEKETMLDYEKNKLLRELKDKDLELRKLTADRSDFPIERPDSACSLDSTISLPSIPSSSVTSSRRTSIDQGENIQRIEEMRKEIDREHAVVIERLKQQLKTDYMLQETRLRERHTAKQSAAAARHSRQLESLKAQYEEEVQFLRKELETERQRAKDQLFETETKLSAEYRQHAEEFNNGLSFRQKIDLERLLSSLDRIHQQKAHQKEQEHKLVLALEVKAMRVTQEQIYASQLELTRTALEEQRVAALVELQRTMSQENREEADDIERLWASRLELLQGGGGDMDLTEKSSKSLMNELNRRLTKEHQQLLQTLNVDKPDGEQSSNIDSSGNQDDSIKTSEDDFTHTADDIKQSLEFQREEILQLRAKILSEYDELLQVRADLTASHADQVGNLQREIDGLQEQYQAEVAAFQSKLQERLDEDELHQSQEADRSKEMSELQNHYEKKCQDMEESFSNEIKNVRIKYESELELIQSRLENSGIFSESKDLQDSDTSFQGEEQSAAISDAKIEHIESKYRKELQDFYQQLVELTEELKVSQKREQDLAEENNDMEQAHKSEMKAFHDSREKERQEELNIMETNMERQLEALCQQHASEMDAIKLPNNVENNERLEHSEVIEQNTENESKLTYDLREVESKYRKELEDLCVQLSELTEELISSQRREQDLGGQYSELELAHKKGLQSVQDAHEQERKQDLEAMESNLVRQLQELRDQHAAELDAIMLQKEGEQSNNKIEDLETESKISKENVSTLETQLESSASSEVDDDTPELRENHRKEIEDLQQQLSDLKDELKSSQRREQDLVSGYDDIEVSHQKAVQAESDARERERLEDLVTMETNMDRQLEALRKQHDEELDALRESQKDSETSSEVVEKLREDLDATKTKEAELIGQLEDLRYRHQEEINEVRDTQQHEKMVVIETLQSDFNVQLEVELKRHASEIEARISEIPLQKDSDDEKPAKETVISEIPHQKDNDDETPAEDVSEKEEKESDFETRIENELSSRIARITKELQNAWEQESVILNGKHKVDIENLQKQLTAAEEKYDKLMEDIRNGECKEVNDLMADKYDLELEMARTLMQQEFDETLDAEQERITDNFESELRIATEDFNRNLQKLSEEHKAEVIKLTKEHVQELEQQKAVETDNKADDLLSSGTQELASYMSQDDPSYDEIIVPVTSTPAGASDDEGTRSYEDERSTPVAMLQTRSFADVVRSSPPATADEAPLQESTKTIYALKDQINQLTDRLKSQSSEQALVLDRRQRENNEEGNLIMMLRADLDRINSERDALQHTNNHLLTLLSDSVKSCMAVEENINKKLAKIVSKDSPVQQPGSGGRWPGSEGRNSKGKAGTLEKNDLHGAVGGPPADISADSLKDVSLVSSTDEGLDLSQQISESIFCGPELDDEGEAVITESTFRVQSAISRLLSMIEDTTQQLMEAKSLQSELLDTLASRTEESERLTAHCQELDDRLRQEVEAKEFLALELHKAEGLIDGYASQQEALEKKIRDTEDHGEALVINLETTQNRLHDLESSRMDAESLREEVQRQQALMQTGAHEESRETTMTISPEEPELMLEIQRLNEEKRALQHQLQESKESYESRLRSLSSVSDEQTARYEEVLEGRKQELEDLHLQLDAVDKQLKSNKQFIEEQAAEREQEREDYNSEVLKIQKVLQTKERQQSMESRLEREVQDLTDQLQSRLADDGQLALKKQQLERDLMDKSFTAEELKGLVVELEAEIEKKNEQVNQLHEKLSRLEAELVRLQELNDSLAEEIKAAAPEQLKKVITDLETRLENRHRTSQENLLSVEEELRRHKEAEEALTHEKNTLQDQAKEQLVHISALKNQLDEFRQRFSDNQPPQNTGLQIELSIEREALNVKQKEVSDLETQLEQFRAQLIERGDQLEQITAQNLVTERQLEAERSDGQQALDELTNQNQQLKVKLKKLSDRADSELMSSLAQTLIEEKNEEIDHLTASIAKLRSQITEGADENKIQKLTEDLDQKDKEIADLLQELGQFRQNEQLWGDTSLSDDRDHHLMALSLTDRASLQQELGESAAQRQADLEDLRTQVGEKEAELVESAAQRQADLEDLRTQLWEKEAELVESAAQRQADIEDLRTQLREKEAELEKSAVQRQADRENLHTQLRERDAELEEVSNELRLRDHPDTALNGVIQEKDSSIQELTIQLETQQREIAHLSDFQSKLQEDFDTIQSMLDEKEREIESLTRELIETRLPADGANSELITRYELDFIRLEKALIAKDNIIEEKEEDLCGLLDEKASHANEVQTLKVKMSRQEQDLAARTAELKTVKNQLESNVKIHVGAYQTELVHVKEQLEQTTSQLAEREDQLQKLQQELTAIQEQNTDEIIAFKSQYTEEYAELVAQREARVRELSHSLDQQTMKGEVLSHELDGKLTEVADLMDRLMEKDAIISELSEQLDRQEDGGRDGVLVAEMDGLRGVVKEKSAEIERLHQHLASSQQQLDDQSLELDDVSIQCRHLEHAKSEQAVRSDQRENEIQDLRNQLKETRSEVQSRSPPEAPMNRQNTLDVVTTSHGDEEGDVLTQQRINSLSTPTVRGDADRGREEELKRRVEELTNELAAYRDLADVEDMDYARKFMELREQLNAEHDDQIEALHDRADQERLAYLTKMKEHDAEIKQILDEHEQELQEAEQRIREEIGNEHGSEISELVQIHQRQQLQKHPSSAMSDDSSVIELDRRLNSELANAEQIDNRLLDHLGHQRQAGVGRADGKGVAEASINGSMSLDDSIPMRLQALLNRLHNEGVQMMTLSELRLLRQFASPTHVDQEADFESVQAAWENEKQSLLSAMQSLKDLLAQVQAVRNLDKSPETSMKDWRSELLHAVCRVFSKEREILLSELRTHVLSHSNVDLDDIQHLEQKIREQEASQRASLEQLYGADRQSLLTELRDWRANHSINSLQFQEDRQLLSERLNSLEDNTSQRERHLKRQLQLLEYKLQQEKVLLEDSRTSLEMERGRSVELSSHLTLSKNQILDLQADVETSQVNVSKLHDAFEREKNRLTSVTSALEEEKNKTAQLTNLLDAHRSSSVRLEREVDDAKEKIQRAQEHEEHIIERLQYDVSAERAKQQQSSEATEEFRVSVRDLHLELDSERQTIQSLRKDSESKVSQLHTMLELEKNKTAELGSALERERALSGHLQQSLSAERGSLQQASAKENSVMVDLHEVIESERSKVQDLQSSLEREKQQISAITGTLDAERRQAREDLDKERSICRQLKKEVDQLQNQKIELKKETDYQSELVTRGVDERDALRSELKTIKDKENERERQRESERLAERRQQRENERMQTEYRMKLHEHELQAQQLQHKVGDLEALLAESRQRELHIAQEREYERAYAVRSPVPSRQSAASEQSQAEDVIALKHRLNVYKKQMESLRQRLQTTAVKHQEEVNRSQRSVDGAGSPRSDHDIQTVRSYLSDLIAELRQLQAPLTLDSENEPSLVGYPAVQSINDKILHHNAELTNFIARLSQEKVELRSTLSRLEEEIWQYRQKDLEVQNQRDLIDSTEGTLIRERADWAKERLQLQLALSTGDRENERLATDLRIARDRQSSTGAVAEYDQEKMQRLYGKYLRAESYRKALIYQKKYLLLLLGGFEDCEQATLSLISKMGVYPSTDIVRHRRRHSKAFTRFRTAARVVIAVCRMKYLVQKWRRATKVGSSVAASNAALPHGYLTHAGQSGVVNGHAAASYSPPRYNATRAVHSTPPTRERSSESKYYISPTSGTRRQLLSSFNSPSDHVLQSSPGRRRQASEQSMHEDYIQRLANLQQRLGGLSSGAQVTSPSSRHSNRLR